MPKSHSKSKSKAVIPPKENETNNEELETLKQILEAAGLRMVEVKQDPSNAFRALSDQEHNDGGKDYRNAQKLRKKVTLHLLENETKFSKHFEGDFDAHVMLVKTDPKTYGTDLEIMAWGDKYGRTVEVYSATGTTCYEYDGPNPNPVGTARLSRHGGNHYNSVKPLDSVAITDTDTKSRIWGDDQNEELIYQFETGKLNPRATDRSYLKVAFNTMSESTQALGFPIFLKNYVEKGAMYCEGDWMLLQTFRFFNVKKVRTPKERKIHYDRFMHRLKTTDAGKSMGAASDETVNTVNEPSDENTQEPSLVDEVYESHSDGKTSITKIMHNQPTTTTTNNQVLHQKRKQTIEKSVSVILSSRKTISMKTMKTMPAERPKLKTISMKSMQKLNIPIHRRH